MSKELFSLEDRLALVTGASSGIGRQCAFALALAGAKVILVARRQERLEAIGDEIRAVGAEAFSCPLDLETPGAVKALQEYCRQTNRAPDIVVNAAGFNPRKPAETVDEETWESVLRIHLSVPFFIAQTLTPMMIRRGWGRIINIASLQSVRAFENGLPYGTAKGGVVQMTRAMAQAWSRHGVNCNAIAPGFFPTALTASVFDNPDQAKINAERTMIGRNGYLEDLDGITVFLASRASDYITGQTIFVDGGFSAQ